MVMLLFWRFSFLPLLEDSAASNGNVNNGKVDISLQEALSLGGVGWGGEGEVLTKESGNLSSSPTRIPHWPVSPSP